MFEVTWHVLCCRNMVWRSDILLKDYYLFVANEKRGGGGGDWFPFVTKYPYDRSCSRHDLSVVTVNALN